jgi:hypothetical protein
VECSLRRFNAACINIAHMCLENNLDNKSRRLCHLRFDDPEAENIVCPHEPECVESTKHDLGELKKQITRFKTHMEDTRSTVAGDFPVAGCTTRNQARTEERLLVHLVNEHSHGPIPPLGLKSLNWKCPRWDISIVADGSIRDHINASQQVSVVSTRVFRRKSSLLVRPQAHLAGPPRRPCSPDAQQPGHVLKPDSTHMREE